MQNHTKVCVEQDVNAATFAALIGALNLKPPVLIKPNWGTVECFNEADILDWTLAAIPGEKIVIESHGWARDEETLLKKGSTPLTKAHLRKSDRWFQNYTAIEAVLQKHNVEYLNITEEVWAKRTADAEQVRQAVEAQYAPVQFSEHYERVPQRLFALRGGSLLSLAKFKLMFEPLGISMALKNLFGLIPGPSRGKYHGTDHTFLNQNIVDINKIYHSLFAVKGVIEAVHSMVLWEEEAAGAQVLPGFGCAMASEDVVTLDAYATTLAGRAPQSVGHLLLAAQTFGAWDAPSCAAAEHSGINVMER
jgi:uncharacterized protein (DUF362 family)